MVFLRYTMIQGLAIKKVILHRDERGFFAELLKAGEETFHEIRQTSYSETRLGVVKAFHVHDYWEVWCVIKGRARVVLYDGRPDSPTRGETQVIFAGEDDFQTIAIPPNVAHGYQALGPSPMGIIYHAEQPYDSSRRQIEHIPHDDPAINFQW